MPALKTSKLFVLDEAEPGCLDMVSLAALKKNQLRRCRNNVPIMFFPPQTLPPNIPELASSLLFQPDLDQNVTPRNPSVDLIEQTVCENVRRDNKVSSLEPEFAGLSKRNVTRSIVVHTYLTRRNERRLVKKNLNKERHPSGSRIHGNKPQNCAVKKLARVFEITKSSVLVPTGRWPPRGIDIDWRQPRGSISHAGRTGELRSPGSVGPERAGADRRGDFVSAPG